MTKEIVIKVEALSKVYKLYDAPIDRMKEALHWRGKKYHKDFYALNNVSFEIKKGETIGIIGKNGSGKSTLLKIITGVLSPTTGKVSVNGKVSALLELGAGFNPEYTGIENIYFQGNLMGYTQVEIDAKLDEILSFADIGDFIHQPVKVYSSGMFARLAFAVAINVEPDILIIDETLSVGDAKFILKCFNRLEKLKSSGVTILFVTHAIDQIKSFCSIALLINEGRLIYSGQPKIAGIKYFELMFPYVQNGDDSHGELLCNKEDYFVNLSSHNEKYQDVDLSLSVNKFGLGGAYIDKMLIYGIKNHLCKGGEKITVEVLYRWDINILREIRIVENVSDNLIMGVSISDVRGTYLTGMTTIDKDIMIPISRGKSKIIFELCLPYLSNGEYFFNTAIALGVQESHVQLKWLDGVYNFNVNSVKKNVYGLFYIDYKVEVL